MNAKHYTVSAKDWDVQTDAAMDEAAAEIAQSANEMLVEKITNLPAVQPANELERHIAIVRRTAEAAEQASVEIDKKARAELANVKREKAEAKLTYMSTSKDLDERASMIRARAAEDIATKDRIAEASRAALKVLE